ncbi:hypothetical protein [Candidatus Doolittlea endobia]|uniref:Uncharacterized protein n=1 Tax=Candidatus Doolittlea endobia TaxID=1778262 RepID=A0A143WRZ0_9ENTR|nr:hypothetical protein [Candidatus Doolittlea endobia]CUX96470.1 hypothetical protein MHIR_DE00130 [Candidatus Doolittlea endobia]
MGGTLLADEAMEKDNITRDNQTRRCKKRRNIEASARGLRVHIIADS